MSPICCCLLGTHGEAAAEVVVVAAVACLPSLGDGIQLLLLCRGHTLPTLL